MFYLFELTTKKTSETPTKTVYGPYTETEVGANFHSKMGGAMKNADYISELCVAISEDGRILPEYTEFWARSNEEQEEE